MARSNSKNETTTLKFRTIVKTFAISLVVAVVGLGLVHQHNLHHELADEGKRLDADTRAVEEKIRQSTRIEATLKSPVQLARRAMELNLGLVPIQATQRLFLARNPLAPAAAPLALSTSVGTSPRVVSPALATVPTR